MQIMVAASVCHVGVMVYWTRYDGQSILRQGLLAEIRLDSVGMLLLLLRLL